MPSEKDLNPLEMRLTKLDDAIGLLVESRKTTDFGADEMRTFTTLDPDDERPCAVCVVCRVCMVCFGCNTCARCARCANEFTCGLDVGGGFSDGFSQLGG
jgi:hypothetical protein